MPGDTSSPSLGRVAGAVISVGAAQLRLQHESGLPSATSSLLGTKSAWLGTMGSEEGQERPCSCTPWFHFHISALAMQAE